MAKINTATLLAKRFMLSPPNLRLLLHEKPPLPKPTTVRQDLNTPCARSRSSASGSDFRNQPERLWFHLSPSGAPSVGVLVQPEMESWRSTSVSFPQFSAGQLREHRPMPWWLVEQAAPESGRPVPS